MRTCYLHIGAPKCGSTTIQGFLRSGRDALAAAGLDACDFGPAGPVLGPAALQGALRRERDPQRPETELWRWLDRRIARTSGDLCISHEGLCNHLAREDKLAFVRGFFEQRGVRLKLIAYVRDHVGYLNAAYAQQAKRLRMTQEFDAWLDAALDSARFEYWRRFRPLLADPDLAFSITSLHRLADGGLLESFLAAIDRPGFDASGFDAARYRNATPGPKAIAAGVLIARGLHDLGVDPDSDAELNARFERETEALGWNEAPFFGPDEAATQRILDVFAEGDEALARAAWGIAWNEAASPTRRARNVFDTARAPAAEMDEIEAFARDFVASAQAPRRGWRTWLGLGRGAGPVSLSPAPSAPPGSTVRSSLPRRGRASRPQPQRSPAALRSRD